MSPARVGRYAVVGTLSKGVDEDVLIGEQGSRRVAIRIFSVADREALLEEARKVAGLSHANIAHQEVGLHEERPFLAAELGGTPLETWSGGDHGLPEQLFVIEGIAAGLAHAHGQGVVHGRLVPARVVVGADGVARLWGFGLKGTQLDRAGTAYLAPEVLEGGSATPQADVYSAGVLFYEILAGERPSGEAPKPLRDVRKELPKDLADAIMACRERAADWRPKDLDYLLETVRKARGGMPAPKPTPMARPSLEAPRPAAAQRRSAGPPVLPIAIAVVLLGGGAAYYFLLRGSGATPTGGPATTTTTTTLATPAATEATLPPVAPSVAPTTPSAAPVAATPTPAPTATPRATPPPSVATPPPTTTTTLPPAPSTTLAAAPTLPPASTVPAAPGGPAVLRTVSPPALRRGQRTLVDVRGQNLYAGQGAALLRGGRPAEGVRVVQQRVVNPTLAQIFIEVDAQAAPGAYSLLLSDGQSVTNAIRFDVAK